MVLHAGSLGLGGSSELGKKHTNVINLLNRVPEHDSKTFFVLHNEM